MSKSKIEPHKVTKPIQLLAAWLAGLVLLDAAFLGAAATLTAPSWAPGALVIASIVNVPIFVICIFLLQTRFRPEMQEDTYYAKYLDNQTGTMRSDAVQEVSALRAEFSKSNSRTLDMIESVQSHVTALAESARISSQLNEDEALKLKTISEESDRSSKLISSAKQIARWERYSVSINDLLPAYSKIQKALDDHLIPISTTFGSGSNNPDIPQFGILSFGPDVELEAIVTILDLVQIHGIDFISYTAGERHKQHIVIGSYIYLAKSIKPREYNYVPITGAITAAINDPATTIESLVQLILELDKRQ